MTEEAKESGAALIGAKLRQIPSSPGVYRMIGTGGRVLYVGKARALRKRVAAYAKPDKHPLRIQRMIALTQEMDFTLTRTESEALLMEAAMIKREKPPFNIIMRDDKSFPSIALIEGRHAPRIMKHRGARKEEGTYFGPFVSARMVDDALQALQRGFLLRSCSDSVYQNRSRPCLLYQIKRCSAPCTDEISESAYRKLAHEARLFLEGKSRQVQERLAKQMDEASAAKDFERAALYRDRLRALERIQMREPSLRGIQEADLFAIHREGGDSCVELYIIRDGRALGNRAYFPKHGTEEETAEILSAFIGQFYAKRRPPKRLLLSEAVASSALLEEALALRAGRGVRIHAPQRGGARTLCRQALINAKAALGRRLAETGEQTRLLGALAEKLRLKNPPNRVEIYDNSHIQGALPVGAMVVAGREGFMRKQYRLFHIKDAPPSDDLAMMREVFRRRFTRLMREEDREGGAAGRLDAGRLDAGTSPDLVIIDGGEGQVRAARQALQQIKARPLPLLGIAKGAERNAGRERFFFKGRAFSLDHDDPLLYYLQRLRDEAHRFALAAHARRRRKAMGENPLDSVPGIGRKRKSAMLRHFGSAKDALRASAEELAAVQGISARLARRIHQHLNSEA